MKNTGENGRRGAGHTRPRRLLLCLDGVPHEIIEAARERGLFDAFHRPSRLLSPFPTLTNVALAAMFKASAPMGYESLYFDRSARELRGGVSKYIGRRTPDKVPSSYMDELDYQEPLPFEFLIYVAPEAVWRADMRRFHERFRAAPQDRDYFAFLKGTDGLLHICGRERLDVALESLDRILRDIHAACGAETEIVLFSDHGMNLQENRRAHLRTQLRRSGFEMTDRLRGQGRHHVASPAFGLCGYAALYCADEEAASQVSDALVPLEGLDFAIHRDGASAIMVKGTRGTARIRRQENVDGAFYRYEQLTGDPLLLAPIVRALGEEGLLKPDGSALDRIWFERTASHVYPDALANLYESLHTPRVHHTADVLASFEDGYYYGNTFFSRFVSIAATHGNALRSSSTAFLMSTHRTFSEHVRATEANPLLKG
jgi:Type I phosphodiesterase / nucleotide pyrophosphatase